jgi:pyruvate,water dikinase
MSRLGEISGKLDIPVPRGFCLTARLFEDIMSEGNLRNQIDDILNNLDYDDLALIQKASREIQDLIISFNIPASFRQTILDAYDTTFPGSPAPRLSVRSSALGEDSEKYSFAGLHHSELNVNRDNLVDACWEVLASKYSPQSLVYRFISGLRDEDMPMSVGCMEMINSQCSGILFTKDPNGQGDNIIIQAVRGLGTMAVEGRVTPQEYIVSHSPEGKIFGFRPGNQKFKDVLNIDQGVKKEAIMPEYWYMPCLTQDQVSLLAGYACRIEEHFAVPQDIEWAVDNNGCLHILQSRPLNIKPAKGTAPENMLNRGTPRPDINELDSKYEVLIKAGDCASTGVATGSVFKVQNVRDIKNFPNGSIIVAKKNLPEFASLIHKVAAVVTELGSTTGHLSIIARELNVPILTNIGNAASRLENGMEITLFADEKRIYKGRVDEIINYYKSDDTLPTQANDPFRNSPLYRIWHSIAKLIFKLNLTETNSPRFSPEHCETIHDIIRFAHETAMKNMFSLYESERLDSGQAFYLKFDVPLERLAIIVAIYR